MSGSCEAAIKRDKEIILRESNNLISGTETKKYLYLHSEDRSTMNSWSRGHILIDMHMAPRRSSRMQLNLTCMHNGRPRIRRVNDLRKASVSGKKRRQRTFICRISMMRSSNEVL